MPDPSLNPSLQVERIREILVGRQLHQVEDRLQRLEEGPSVGPGPTTPPDALPRLQQAQDRILRETQQLRQELQQESQLRARQITHLAEHLDAASRKLDTASAGLKQQDRQLSHHLEEISAAMAARIDARVREILHHLQREIGQWKNQVDRDLEGVRKEGIQRPELNRRFARLASAAMEDDPAPEPEEDGFLL